MSYLGRGPLIGAYKKLDALTFNGSTTTFTLTSGGQAVYPGTAQNLIISVGGVLQEPGAAFTLNGNGPTITFTTAPTAAQAFFGFMLGEAVDVGVSNLAGQPVSANTPSNGDVMTYSTSSGAWYPTPASPNSAVWGMKVASVAISNTQINSACTSPVTIVAALGATKVIVPVFVVMHFARTTTVFSASPNFSIRYAGIATDLVTQQSFSIGSSGAGDSFREFPRNAYNFGYGGSDPRNKALVFFSSADTTGGQGTCYVSVGYYEAEVG